MTAAMAETEHQDESLDLLSGTVKNLKKFGGAISEELDVHCRLLGEMEDQTDDSRHRIRQQQKSLDELSSQSTMCALWACIFAMAVAIFVLLVFF
mmetsp:Transcript_11858/g.28274  ORF Transcript_11858/g.28274 Transcript_11858/m.28274 type:complete len:95 (-) Transcript_11858:70-354(-)|eukprot:s1135_g2.t1